MRFSLPERSDFRQSARCRLDARTPGTEPSVRGKNLAGSEHRRRYGVYRRIVVGTDGSPTADRAVDVAGELARMTGADVHVVTAYRPVRAAAIAGASAAGGAVVPAWFGDDERVAAEEVVRRATERLGRAGVSARSVARLGEPADALLAVTEEFDADLVVIGNRGLSGVRRYLLGAVADRVAHHAPCSVHIVHTC
jgi:nucleotide-binding universal stress UspA family protein